MEEIFITTQATQRRILRSGNLKLHTFLYSVKFRAMIHLVTAKLDHQSFQNTSNLKLK